MEQTDARTRSHRIARFALRWCVLLGMVYLGVVLVFWFLERRLVFQPSSVAESWHPPVELATQDVSIVSTDGTRLHGWWLPGRDSSTGAILVAHGNGGNLSHRGYLASDLRRTTGAGVLLFDYPGYGKSEGKPTEAGCYAAGEASLKWLMGEAKIPSDRIVLMGESLGGGTAIELATRHDHRALVLVFTFTSLPAAAKALFPLLPAGTLMQTRFDNLAKIGRCHRPVFIAHGTADLTIPFAHGEALFAAANPPREFLRLEGFGHSLPREDQLCLPLAKFLNERAPLK